MNVNSIPPPQTNVLIVNTEEGITETILFAPHFQFPKYHCVYEGDILNCLDYLMFYTHLPHILNVWYLGLFYQLKSFDHVIFMTEQRLVSFGHDVRI